MMKMAEFLKKVGNTVGNTENARYKQYFLFPQCSQKTFNVDMLKPALVWEMVKSIPNNYDLK